jgi:hypothetical protein
MFSGSDSKLIMLLLNCPNLKFSWSECSNLLLPKVTKFWYNFVLSPVGSRYSSHTVDTNFLCSLHGFSFFQFLASSLVPCWYLPVSVNLLFCHPIGSVCIFFLRVLVFDTVILCPSFRGRPNFMQQMKIKNMNIFSMPSTSYIYWRY